MIDVRSTSPLAALEERLLRGAQLLFDLEQRGDTENGYPLWFERWVALLEEYESLDSASQGQEFADKQSRYCAD